MNAELNLSKIMSQVRLLDRSEQLTLLEKLALMIRKAEQKEDVKLSSISGIGRSLWQNTNIDDYIDQERQW